MILKTLWNQEFRPFSRAPLYLKLCPCDQVWLFICCKTKLKNICFVIKYTLFAEKNVFIWKKSFIMKEILF